MNNLLTTADAAERMGVNASRIRQLCLSGELAAIRVGRDWVIELTTVVNFQRKPVGRPPENPNVHANNDLRKPKKTSRKPRKKTI